MFYHLFKEYDESESELKEILLKQIHYITRPISSLRVHTQIIRKLQTTNDFFIKNGIYLIDNKRGQAQLEIFDRYISLKSNGNIDIELLFMDALRETEFNFFAVDVEHERYGWLKPMKERKYV